MTSRGKGKDLEMGRESDFPGVPSGGVGVHEGEAEGSQRERGGWEAEAGVIPGVWQLLELGGQGSSAFLPP